MQTGKAKRIEQKLTKETKKTRLSAGRPRNLRKAEGNFFVSLCFLGVQNSCCLGLIGYKRAVHPLFQKADKLSRQVIGAAIEVHRLKGPGLIESIYERCLMRELALQQIAAVNQHLVRIEYKGLVFDEPLRFDVLVENCLLVELKCVQEILPLHKAQLLSYMKLLDIPLGLIINFHEMKLTDGLVRMILPGANREGETE